MKPVPYKEEHFTDVPDIGVAFDTTRVWVCLNGASLLRAKAILDPETNEPRLIIDYTPKD